MKENYISTNKIPVMERVGFFLQGFFTSLQRTGESEVKNTLELPVKVVSAPLKFKKAFP